MNRLWPSQIILTTRYSNVTGSTSITAQITALDNKISAKQALKAPLVAQLATQKSALTGLENFYSSDRGWYEHYAAKNQWDQAIFHRDRADNETAPQIADKKILVQGLEDDIQIIDEDISSLNTQRTTLLTQQLNDVNLTPAQRIAAQKAKAEADRLAIELDSKTKNKRIIVIASAIIGVIGVIGLIVYIIKKRKGAKTASA